MTNALRTVTRAASGVFAALVAAPIVIAQAPPDSGIALGGQRRTIREVVVSILNYLLGFVGLIAVAMLIYGGFRYLTSAGNEEVTKKAKSVILYAIIGIVIIALSFVIVNTIITQGRSVIESAPVS